MQSDDIVTVFISTDNARNVTAAVRQLPSWNHIRCFDHTLDLGVKDAKKGEEVIKTLLSKLTESEWHILELLEKILEPLERATEIMSGSFYPTLSMAIPVLCGIDEAITSFEKKYNDEFELPLVLRLYLLELKDSLDLRFSHMKNNNLYIKAMVLDPRFKCLLMDEGQTKKVIEDIVSEIMCFKNQMERSLLSSGI